jgi:hypothetical protein
MELLLIIRNLPRQERFERPLSLGCKCSSRFRGIICPFQRRSIRTSEGLTLRCVDFDRNMVPKTHHLLNGRGDMTKSARISRLHRWRKGLPVFVRASTPSSDTALKFLE